MVLLSSESVKIPNPCHYHPSDTVSSTISHLTPDSSYFEITTRCVDASDVLLQTPIREHGKYFTDKDLRSDFTLKRFVTSDP